MSSKLKSYHPYLYRRVQLKGILFTLLGLSSVFARQLDTFFHAERNNVVGVSSLLTGGVFLLIGLAILAGLYFGEENYKKSRKALYVAFGYALFWEIALVALAFNKHISTVSIFILWGYLTYNLFLVASDSGWEGAELVKEIRENGDGSV